jgi:hypothetical protein
MALPAWRLAADEVMKGYADGKRNGSGAAEIWPQHGCVVHHRGGVVPDSRGGGSLRRIDNSTNGVAI